MSEWKETTLGEIATIQTGPFGSQLKNEQYIKGGTPVITVEHIKSFKIENFDYPSVTDEDKERLKKYTLKQGDIIFSRVGSVDLSALVSQYQEGWLFSSRMLRVRPKINIVNPIYLSYYLRLNVIRAFINSVAVGTTMPSLNTDILKTIPVKLTPLKEQKQIADVLSCLDNKIENLRRQNETLEKIAQALFKHWFIDFEFPNDDGKPYKSSGGVMVASELGDIPEGWRVGTLGKVAKNHSQTYNFKDKEQIIFINTGDVLNGEFLHNQYVAISDLPGQAKKMISKGDILYSEIRPINKRFAYVNFDSSDYVVSTKFMIIRANDLILTRFLYLILKRQDTIQEFQKIAESRSGTFPQITFESVSNFDLVIPGIDVQKKLMILLTRILEKQEFNIKYIKTLTKTRNTLLPKLMSGQIRIKEEESIIEEGK